MLSTTEFLTAVKRVKAKLYRQDVEGFLDNLPIEPIFDLTVTSPPYDIGKPYEKRVPLGEYLDWQKGIIEKIVKRTKDTGSICWQVGNYAENGSIRPLDIEIAHVFYDLGLKLRNRIIWHFGHGMHAKQRFSGRYEVVLWFSKTDNYTFDLDAVRIPSKYPSKRYFKGAKKGQLSCNPLGKNPEDVWDIPNVVGNHMEKTIHPCQFPVGLVHRLVLALSKKGDLVFDPFAGAASTAVAALAAERLFVGTEISKEYVRCARERIRRAKAGLEPFRPANKPVYDHTKSNLSVMPEEFLKAQKGEDVN